MMNNLACIPNEFGNILSHPFRMQRIPIPSLRVFDLSLNDFSPLDLIAEDTQ